MLWWLGQNLVIAAVLTCVVAALGRLGRFRPAVSHALWLVVLLKLPMPPVITWPWALPELLPEERSLPTSVEYLAVPEVDLTRPATSADPTRAEPPTLAGQPTMPSEPLRNDEVDLDCQVPTRPWWRPPALSAAFLFIWLSGAALMAYVQLIRILRFRKLSAHGKRAPRCLARQVG